MISYRSCIFTALAVMTMAVASTATKESDHDNITSSKNFLRGGSGADYEQQEHRILQDEITPNGICSDSFNGIKFENVPNNGVRTVTHTCPVGEILLTYECITGGGGKAVSSRTCRGAVTNICTPTFSDNGSPVFKEFIQETKLIESNLRDGRRVATGVTCAMVHDNSEFAITKKDATLAAKITCGKPEDFPDVTLDKQAEKKSRVGAGKNRSTRNTCPSGTEIFEKTCNVGGRGSFEFRSQATSSDDKTHRCTFKNSSGSKKTATITTSTICGNLDRAAQLCNLSNTQDNKSA